MFLLPNRLEDDILFNRVSQRQSEISLDNVGGSIFCDVGEVCSSSVQIRVIDKSTQRVEFKFSKETSLNTCD